MPWKHNYAYPPHLFIFLITKKKLHIPGLEGLRNIPCLLFATARILKHGRLQQAVFWVVEVVVVGIQAVIQGKNKPPNAQNKLNLKYIFFLQSWRLRLGLTWLGHQPPNHPYGYVGITKLDLDMAKWNLLKSATIFLKPSTGAFFWQYF